MIRLHSEGFDFTAGPVTLSVICRARRTRDWPAIGDRQLRLPSAILNLITPGQWKPLSILGGARAP